MSQPTYDVFVEISQGEVDERMLQLLRSLGPAMLESASAGGTEAQPVAPHGNKILLPSVPPAGADHVEVRPPSYHQRRAQWEKGAERGAKGLQKGNPP